MIDRNAKLPLYIQIQDYVLDLIKEGKLKPGESVLSEHELAEQTGVSRLTVRKAYTELVKKGMLKTVQGKGTFVTNSVNTKLLDNSSYNFESASRVIGIVFPEVAEYFGPILKEIERRASEDGYTINLMFNDSIERERHAIEQMLSQNLAGIILTPYRRKRAGVIIKNYEKLSEIGLPFVMIGKAPFHISCDAAYVDDIVGIYDTVHTLMDMNHREFVFLFNANSDPQGLKERSEGFELAIQTMGNNAQPRSFDVTSAGWRDELKQLLLADNPVTAVITDSDHTAAAAYGVIFETGKSIPRDVSVVGYDNSNICGSLQVTLSSVSPNRKLLGKHAYDLLLARMNRDPSQLTENINHNIVIKPTLVLRNSVSEQP